jgi:hypothetical protein
MPYFTCDDAEAPADVVEDPGYATTPSFNDEMITREGRAIRADDGFIMLP